MKPAPLPPLALVALLALVMALLDRGWPWPSLALPGASVIAVLVALAGAAVCGLGVLAFRRARTTVNPLAPETASALVATGIYRHSRNPMYVGFALLLLGWALFLGSLVALLAVPAFVLWMNRLQIAPEEAALEQRFGDEFRRYRHSVRRWL
jgi:protein-S-isoprenylcysteine O-methyltransferase Ste14